MVGDSYIPSRGDVIIINCNPQIGNEQAGRRPALVLSQQLYTKASGMVIICPITNTKGLHSLEIEIPKNHKTSGVIIADQIKSFDFFKRNGVFHDKLPDKLVIKVIEIQSKIIGFKIG